MIGEYKIKTLDEISDILKSKVPIFEGEKKYYSTKGINNKRNYSSVNVSYENKPSRAGLYPDLNNIGFARMKGTNKVFVIDEFLNGSLFSTGFMILQCNPNIYFKYLFWFLFSEDFLKQKDLNCGDGIMGGLKNNSLSKINIPLFSFEEQKEIASILDDTFSSIDKAKDNIERNIKNAKELFQSKLNEIFSKTGEGWKEMKMDEVCEIKSKLINPEELKYQNLLHVGGGNIVAESGELIDLKTAKEERLKSGKFPFNTQVVLYNKIRPYLVKVVRPDFDGICSADMYPLTPNKEEITRDFLYFLLISKRFTDYAIAGSARAGMPKVNRKHLFEYTFSLPSLVNQELIIKDLDDLRTKTQLLEIKYSKKLNEIEELKKSILQKAFSGELVNSDTYETD
jgi:type I restriction enzyme S subunit